MAFPGDWNRKCAVTIDAAQVAGSSGSLSNYPVLLTEANLPSEAFDADGAYPAQNGGGDLRFTSDEAGTTRLACHVVSFVTDNNPANGSAEIRVRVPSLAKGSDTTIWVWYNAGGGQSQPAATDTYGRNATWSEAQIALLMESATPVDATGNHTISIAGSLTSIAGPFGAANSFGGDDRISETDTALVNLPTSHDFTVSIVSRRASSVVDVAVASWEGTDDIGLYSFDLADAASQPGSSPTDAGVRVFWRDLGGNIFNEQGQERANSWVWLDLTSRASNDHQVYAQGASAGTSSATGTVGPFSAFYVGGFAPTGQDFDGDIAQVVAWKTARESDWITTAYNNESAPGTFAAAGTPQDTGASIIPRVMHHRQQQRAA